MYQSMGQLASGPREVRLELFIFSRDQYVLDISTPLRAEALTSNSQISEEEPATDEGLMRVPGWLLHDV